MDNVVEDISPDYEGWLDYDQFVKYMGVLDPKLMKLDPAVQSPKSRNGAKSQIKNEYDEERPYVDKEVRRSQSKIDSRSNSHHSP